MNDLLIHRSELARMIDFVDLRVTATRDDIISLVADACDYGVHSIGSPYCFHPIVVDELKKRGMYGKIDVLGGAGFADGNWPTQVKLASIACCLENGCTEIDLTSNVCYIKSGMWDEYEEEIRRVRTLTRGHILKVIIHTPLLEEAEIRTACEVLLRNDADFVKTDTGRAGSPTTVEHVRTIKETIGDRMKIKAAGGIRDIETICEMIDLGVTRFGMSRNSAIKVLDLLEN